MKIEFLIVSSGKESWLEEAKKIYSKKINGFASFKVVEIKSKNFPRNEKIKKIEFEAEKILGKVSSRDLVCLLDETGKQLDSIEFSNQLEKYLESGKRKIIFIIGGAFGVNDAVKNRADFKWSLSKLVLSHHSAQVTALEQIYRGFTIIKGIPYHNV